MTVEAQGALHTAFTATLRHATGDRIRWSRPSEHVHTETVYGDLPLLPAALLRTTLTQWGHWVRDSWPDRNGRTRTLPVVVALAALGSDTRPRNVRGRHHPPSKTLAVMSGLSPVELLLQPKDRKKWRKLVHAQVIAHTKWFAKAYLIPRRLGGEASHLSRQYWPDKAAKWIQEWSVNESH